MHQPTGHDTGLHDTGIQYPASLTKRMVVQAGTRYMLIRRGSNWFTTVQIEEVTCSRFERPGLAFAHLRATQKLSTPRPPSAGSPSYNTRVDLTRKLSCVTTCLHGAACAQPIARVRVREIVCRGMISGYESMITESNNVLATSIQSLIYHDRPA